MEYLKEVNAFYEVIETKALTSSAISLWFALFHMNSNVDWKKEFKVSGPTLRSKAGLPKTSFKRARRSLVENGLIEHRTVGNRAVYHMKRLSIGEELEIAKELIVAEGSSPKVNPFTGEMEASQPATYLDMKQKELANLRRIGNKLNLSRSDVTEDVKELIEKYQRENM